MSRKTLATRLRNNSSASLVFALLLTSYSDFCSGGLTRGIGISRVDNETRPEATTPLGNVQGINMVTRYNRTVFGFLGIPYAQPPVGDLRFKAPVAPNAWNGTLDAGSDTVPCCQFNDEGELAGDEDCLHLNVFTPQLPASDNSTLLPVMMYIIGGGFNTENNSIERFPPELLLDEDVVFVVPNFRVGLFGFLSTGDEASPGNYGLKDVVRALEWVQESIRNFGGNPNQVTIFGGSSGAMSVHLLALSNLTDGLIHGYITQSGTALANTVNQPQEVAVNRTFQLGEHLGCPTTTSTLLVDCLRGFTAFELLNTSSIFRVWQQYPVNVWTPVIEPDMEGALLTDSPKNLIAAGKIRDLPWIASINRDEGLMVSIPFNEEPDLFDDFLENIDFVLPWILDYQYLVDDVAAYTTALKSYYLNDLTADRSVLLDNFTQLAGDGLFVYSVYDAFQQQLAFAKSPQYLCSFEFTGTFSLTYFFSGGSTEYTGVAHGDEIIYLFGHQGTRLGPSGDEFSETDHFMVDTIVSLWTSFANNGTPSTADSISTTTWEPYSLLNNYLRIGNGTDTALAMKYNLLAERMQFWDQLTAATIMASSGGFRTPAQVLLNVLCLYILSYIL